MTTPRGGVLGSGPTFEDAVDGAMSAAMDRAYVSPGAFAPLTASAEANRERVRAERRRASRRERVLTFLRVR